MRGSPLKGICLAFPEAIQGIIFSSGKVQPLAVRPKVLEATLGGTEEQSGWVFWRHHLVGLRGNPAPTVPLGRTARRAGGGVSFGAGELRSLCLQSCSNKSSL